MSTFAKAALAALAVVASASSAAMAGSDSRYVVKQVSNGPRPAQYMLVRADTHVHADGPYSLTGEESRDRAYRTSIRLAATHPKGPQSRY